MSSYQSVVITAIKEEVPGVKTFTLTYADGSAIPYAAGQFITFVFHHHAREERRSYSISSSPVANEPCSCTVKRIDNGAYSRLLVDRARIGDTLQTTGASGLFTLPSQDHNYEQVFFFAAGIGITPIFSLIKTLLYTQAGKKAVLIYSSRSREDVVFYNKLNALAAAFPGRFVVDYLYSTSFNLARARLSKSLLPILLKEHATTTYNKMQFYVCGPFQYMRMVIFGLEEQGIHNEQIRKENFNTNDRQVTKSEPPDKDPHMVTIKHNGVSHSFAVQFPETILQAAKRHGLALPYSCEVGRCGSCAARCTEGQVWLSYNEVLMDMELKQGSILTCTGHPINGAVIIEA